MFELFQEAPEQAGTEEAGLHALRDELYRVPFFLAGRRSRCRDARGRGRQARLHPSFGRLCRA